MKMVLKEKRIRSFDTDYPIIKKIEEEFNKISFAKNFNLAEEGIKKSEILPLSLSVIEQTGIDNKKSCVNNTVNQLKKLEEKIIHNILIEHNSSHKKNTKERIQGISSKLSFIETGKADLDSGKVTQKIAKEFAESEFEKYRIIQDRLFESDFDRATEKLLKQRDKTG